MREELQKLDIERADLAGKVETARDNWLKVPGRWTRSQIGEGL